MDPTRFAHRLAALHDPALRARSAASLLSELPPDEAVALVSQLVARANRRSNLAAAALESVLRASREHLTHQQLERLRAAAAESGAHEVRSLLSTSPAARSFDHDREAWVDRKLRARTLGERKQLARRLDRDQLARLASDPDPAVLRNLLANPRLTEREALVAAARRPARAAVLEELFRSPRWSQNRRVRRALALNPYSPPALAAAALALLTAPDLREVASDENLSPEVRAQARRLLCSR